MMNCKWPALPTLGLDWVEIEKDELSSAVQRLRATIGDEVFSSLQVAALPIAGRCVSLPFYPDRLLYELSFREAFGTDLWIASYIESSPCSDENERQRSIIVLNGNSPPIHELNARLPLRLSNIEDVKIYLRFFCAYVWSEGGGFWIVEDPSYLPWQTDADRRLDSSVEKALTAPRPLADADDEAAELHACILYQGCLFKAHFKVQPGGMVEMVDDTPIAEELPVIRDKREGVFRIVVSGAE